MAIKRKSKDPRFTRSKKSEDALVDCMANNMMESLKAALLADIAEKSKSGDA